MTDIMASITINRPICVGKICNFCGKKDTSDFPDGGDIRIDFVYGSKNDEDSWHFWACDECADKLFKEKRNMGNVSKE